MITQRKKIWTIGELIALSQKANVPGVGARAIRSRVAAQSARIGAYKLITLELFWARAIVTDVPLPTSTRITLRCACAR